MIMEFLSMAWDSVYALAVGIGFGVLFQRVGLVDWLIAKVLRK
tara:strand:+ start:4771 stop:4899 length:129 start_codon:yes stop_codon:yes gene_type:complete